MHSSRRGRDRFVAVAAFFAVAALVSQVHAKTYRLYYLGGQSNMDGYGFVNQLPAGMNTPVEGAMIFHGNTAGDGQPEDGRGLWSQLKPGHGVGFSSDGNENRPSDRFGVELTFALRMKELHPGEGVAIIKYSRGGTSIDAAAMWAKNAGCWEPDFNSAPDGSSSGGGAHASVNQYDHFLATLRNAMSVTDIDGDGETDALIPAGIVWMQGESDGMEADVAARYEANLRRLMDLMRAALRHDDLPVAIGRISDSGQADGGKVWKHGDMVRAAQAAFCEKDPAAALVTSTDNYTCSDPYHYDTAGYLDLGRQFAEAIAKLEAKE